ncbi:MAG: hypothetical protein ACQEXG_01805 [Pseudomonadota bacterium]
MTTNLNGADVIEGVMQVECRDWLIPEREISTRKLFLLGRDQRFPVAWRDWAPVSQNLPTPGMWVHARLRAMQAPAGCWVLERYVVLKP